MWPAINFLNREFNFFGDFDFNRKYNIFKLDENFNEEKFIPYRGRSPNGSQYVFKVSPIAVMKDKIFYRNLSIVGAALFQYMIILAAYQKFPNYSSKKINKIIQSFWKESCLSALGTTSDYKEFIPEDSNINDFKSMSIHKVIAALIYFDTNLNIKKLYGVYQSIINEEIIKINSKLF